MKRRNFLQILIGVPAIPLLPKLTKSIEPPPVRIGVDPASGNDETIIVTKKGNRLMTPDEITAEALELMTEKLRSLL